MSQPKPPFRISERKWVYYVPDLETLCIVYPDYVDSETGKPPVEWDWNSIVGLPLNLYLDANETSEDRNAIYIGDL